jgi:hypothetical protein|tara:strand:- start:154 stop:285 length:132 start_codon:yes stop_codon:yes gene_type:complete
MVEVDRQALEGVVVEEELEVQLILEDQVLVQLLMEMEDLEYLI